MWDRAYAGTLPDTINLASELKRIASLLLVDRRTASPTLGEEMMMTGESVCLCYWYNVREHVGGVMQYKRVLGNAYGLSFTLTASQSPRIHMDKPRQLSLRVLYYYYKSATYFWRRWDRPRRFFQVVFTLKYTQFSSSLLSAFFPLPCLLLSGLVSSRNSIVYGSHRYGNEA